MLKRIIGQDTQDVSASDHQWLNVECFGASGGHLGGRGASDRVRIATGDRIGLASGAPGTADRASCV